MIAMELASEGVTIRSRRVMRNSRLRQSIVQSFATGELSVMVVSRSKESRFSNVALLKSCGYRYVFEAHLSGCVPVEFCPVLCVLTIRALA